MRGAISSAILSLLAVGAGCGGASADTGLDSLMRASGAQYASGELMSDMTATGPAVAFVQTNSTVITAGLSRNIGGSATGTATAVQIGLSGDNAHWIVPTGTMDTDTPGNFTFQTVLSFSSTLPAGMRTIVFRAVDKDGQLGASHDLAVRVQSPIPQGTLVVSLDWDTESDLDLHVTVPNATDATNPVIVWAKSPLALPVADAMGNPIIHNSAQVAAAGALDYDSNAGCVIDGRRQENLIFPVGTPAVPATPPPSGTYEVRVDTTSLCGQGSARWHAIAVANGDTDNPLGEAIGQVSDLDAARPHVAASGVLAFTFSIP
ncbi:MAG TPA: hypothetical protein VH560_13870 [Polyangia bacterium]|nr:hypothetical protein [Polyangia bacterium]